MCIYVFHVFLRFFLVVWLMCSRASVCICFCATRACIHSCVSHDETFMSLSPLWSWPWARPHSLSLAKWLKGPQNPPAASLPVDPRDAYGGIWYAPQTSSSLSSGKGSGASIWIENTTLFVRIGMSPGIRVYRSDGASLSGPCTQVCSGQSSIRSICYGRQVQMSPAPPGPRQERDWVQDEEALGAQRWLRSHRNLCSFHKHGSHLQQTLPGEPNRRTAVSGDKWLLLNGVVPGCRASLVVSPSPEFHFVKQYAIVCHCIITLNMVTGWSKQIASKLARSVSVCVQIMKVVL